MNRTLSITRGVAFAAALACAGCSSTWTGSDYYETQARLQESRAHIAGEALAQRKQQMRRAHRDLVSAHTTMEGLRRHRNLQDIRVFEGFLRPYLGEHVDRLLSRKDRSWNAELEPLDANLLFAKAAVLIELRDKRELDRVIHEIATRFEGRQEMLVEYPLGTQSTLARSVSDLRLQRLRI